ncbi:MAG: hypothetical protein V1777_01775 [Candidatus Micrarchaeota archaeon]
MVEYRTLAKDLVHIAILAALVFAAVFLLTWTGVMKCSTIPGWCDPYYFLVRGGTPRILIVSGDAGMGNPDLLGQTLGNPEYAGVRPTQTNIELVNLGNLKQYDLVIVEKARQVSTLKLKSFMDYVNQGGRLVWTGDAGTELASGDELLLANEVPDSDSNSTKALGPWARKEGQNIVPFHEFLGVQYRTSYCLIKACQGLQWQGTLQTSAGRDHPLAYALRQGLVLRGDFAIVSDVSGSITTRVLSLNWQSELIGNDRVGYGKIFPVIVTSGYGERVAYYAVPPEQFVEDYQPEKYYSLVENLYYGMLR